MTDQKIADIEHKMNSAILIRMGKLGMTPKELAKKAEGSVDHINEILNKERSMSVYDAAFIGFALGIDLLKGFDIKPIEDRDKIMSPNLKGEVVEWYLWKGFDITQSKNKE